MVPSLPGVVRLVTAVQVVTQAVAAAVAITVRIDLDTFFYLCLIVLLLIRVVVRDELLDDDTFLYVVLSGQDQVVVSEQCRITGELIVHTDRLVLAYRCVAERSGGNMINRVVEFDTVQDTLVEYDGIGRTVLELGYLHLGAGYDYRSLVDGQCSIRNGDVVVMIRSNRRDGISTNRTALLVGADIIQFIKIGLVLFVLPAFEDSGVLRCLVAVGKLFVIRGDGERSLVNRYLTVDESNSVVGVAYTTWCDGVLAYDRGRSVLARISDCAGEHIRIVLALPSFIGHCVLGRVIAVDDGLVVRGSGQGCLGDGHYDCIRRLVVKVVGITNDAVINAVGIGILSLRQSGAPTLLVIRGEGIFERTMLGCTGCNQCLYAAVIGQRVSCRSGEGRIGFVNNECTLDIGDVVVSPGVMSYSPALLPAV